MAMAATAALTVVLADLGIGRLSPPRYVREITDAVAEYEHEDPTTLVLGSSHARTFTVMDGLARARTGGGARVLGVPLEVGKFTSYEWVLQHRLRPLIEEDGGKKRPSLRHFVLLTQWWDACGADGDPPQTNIASRAWTFPYFFRDVADHGLNDYNRNYLTSRWLEMWHGSVLVAARGQDYAVAAIRETLRPSSEEALQKRYDDRLVDWQALQERGALTMGHQKEMDAADRILAYFQARGVDVTLMVYPLLPTSITAASRRGTLEPFVALMKGLAERRGVRFIDTTYDHDLESADWQPDFDHLKPDAHVKFSNWLLDGKMSFLLPGKGEQGGAK